MDKFANFDQRPGYVQLKVGKSCLENLGKVLPESCKGYEL